MLVQSSSCILISSEIQEEFLWPFRQFLNGMPAAFFSHEREAFYSRDGSDFRITLDDTILFRQEDLSLESDVYGVPLPPGKVLMEIKCTGSIPIRMVHVLSEEHIYKTSFSKYGTAYQSVIYPK